MTLIIVFFLFPLSFKGQICNEDKHNEHFENKIKLVEQNESSQT